MNQRIPLILAAVLILLASCGFPIRYTEVRGSGIINTETRRVSGFDAIEMNGIGNVMIRQGDKESLQITTDDNLTEYIRSSVNGKTLMLEIQEGVHLLPSDSITYLVTVKSLNQILIDGAGKIEVSPLTAGNLKISINGDGIVNFDDVVADVLAVDISGLGEVNAAGEVNTLYVDLSGSGKIQVSELRARMGTFDVSGSGDISAWVTDVLTVDISGSGMMDYYGSPVVNATISGSGNVISLGQKQ